MYYVRFIRSDQQQNEEYLYLKEVDAIYHFNLFKDDDSGLYKEVVLGYVGQSTEKEVILQKMFFQ